MQKEQGKTILVVSHGAAVQDRNIRGSYCKI